MIGPADAAYETARKVHNGVTENRPAVSVRCVAWPTVLAALQFGLEQRLPIAAGGLVSAIAAPTGGTDAHTSLEIFARGSLQAPANACPLSIKASAGGAHRPGQPRPI